MLLGGLAAADVGGREAQLKRALQPLVNVVIARADIERGAVIRAAQLTVRRVPSRFTPAVALEDARVADGRRASVAIPAGADVTAAHLVSSADGSDLRAGERYVEVLATGSAAAIEPGTHVDVLVTTDRGGTRLALENAEVLASRPASDDGSATRLIAGLRTTIRQAVYLTAAQSFAREIRLLPRGDDDSTATSAGLRVAPDLGG